MIRPTMGIAIFSGALLLSAVCPAAAQTCSLYKIELQGRIGDSHGGNSFHRSGILAISPEALGGSGNAAEVWIQSGNPVTSPETGSLFVASNTAFIGSLSDTLRAGQLALARVQKKDTEDGVLYVVTVTDQFAISQGGMFNVVNMSGGVIADPKLVDSGTIEFILRPLSGELSGELKLKVRNWLTNPHRASIFYEARFKGVRAGQFDECIAGGR